MSRVALKVTECKDKRRFASNREAFSRALQIFAATRRHNGHGRRAAIKPATLALFEQQKHCSSVIRAQTCASMLDVFSL